MNKLSKVIIIVLACVSGAAFARTLVDRIVAIIYHESGTICVLASDVRPGLDGRQQTLKQVIFDRLMEADALYHRVVITDAEADAFIEKIQQTHKISRKAVEDLFKEMGYTYQEAREFLRRRQMIERVVEFRIKSDKRLLIDKAEVESYYKNMPLSELRVYTLAIAFIPQETLAGKSIDQYLQNVDISQMKFDEPFTLRELEIADDRRSIIGKPAGSIVFTEPVEGGYEVTKLDNVSVVSFEECYVQLLNAMRQERFGIIFKEYHEMLLKQATILFNDPRDKELVYGADV